MHLPNSRSTYQPRTSPRYTITCTHTSSTHPQSRNPGSRRPGCPNDMIYNDTGRVYHYPRPLRTMANIRSSHAENTLMTRLQRELQMTLYYSALDPTLLPVHLQKQQAQLLLEQLALLDRVAR